jgi:uncharacterized protein YgiB involved in biofilm formation
VTPVFVLRGHLFETAVVKTCVEGGASEDSGGAWFPLLAGFKLSG